MFDAVFSAKPSMSMKVSLEWTVTNVDGFEDADREQIEKSIATALSQAFAKIANSRRGDGSSNSVSLAEKEI